MVMRQKGAQKPSYNTYKRTNKRNMNKLWIDKRNMSKN